ncbi:hypothetical protein CTEN210_00273 [Chaetoceros tenuissimus]|uniref:Sialate O-acetylesterase domain-containing protein n=1 Tax=Chaetoceros tenuissimus TaxID=426638 RepID=A0AAD3CFP7_9STRA|nr:hypothetical protein CTEN210_00273 [Chaetoceros tenuissimus]
MNPLIHSPFDLCHGCQDTLSCPSPIQSNECARGCQLAEPLESFYETYETHTYVDIPRFLFAGQSNMEGHSSDNMNNMFHDIRMIIRKGLNKTETIEELTSLILSTPQKKSVPSKRTARGMASSLFTTKKFIKNRSTKENAYCSFTEPEEDEILDCERLVGPEACGYKHTAFGPELMFAHRFPTFDTMFQNRQIGITKVARGGSTLRQWMKKNENSEDESNYWTVLRDAIHATKDTLEAFVWFQGENDAWEHISAQDYFGNLTEFVSDVRNEIYNVTGAKFSQPSEIPVIIVEVGTWAFSLSPDVLQAQRNFVANDPFSKKVNTGVTPKENKMLSPYYHYDAASYLIIGNRIAQTMKSFYGD